MSNHFSKFGDAVSHCFNQQSYLISYETKGEFDEVAKNLPDESYYIGLIYHEHEDEHRWVSNEQVATWTKWNPGGLGNPQPQKNPGETCTIQHHIYYNDRSWYDDFCKASKKFICEKNNF